MLSVNRKSSLGIRVPARSVLLSVYKWKDVPRKKAPTAVRLASLFSGSTKRDYQNK